MNRRQFVASAASVAGASLSSAAAAQDWPSRKKLEKRPPLTIAIAASKLVGSDRKALYPDYAIQGVIPLRTNLRCINVVIQNRSKNTVTLWDENNGWGFTNLRLEVLGMTDNLSGRITPWEKPVIVQRGGSDPEIGADRVISWDSSVEAACVLAPGEIVIRNIGLYLEKDKLPNPGSADPYYGFPLPPNASRKMRMRAVLTIPEEPSAWQYNVWTGTVASPAGDYLVTQV